MFFAKHYRNNLFLFIFVKKNMENLQYPIGKFEPIEFSESYKKECIETIQNLPNKLKAVITTLDEKQIHTPYREGGWTVFELIHHIADSHGQAFFRFKLALTEESPTIKPYNEKAWVKTPDVVFSTKELCLSSIEILHQRWVILLQHILDEEWETKAVFHPAQNKKMSLWFLLTMYAWHSKHHLAHITHLMQRNNW